MQPNLFSLPIAPASDPVSRHCSSMGAVSASERVGRQCLRLLSLYRASGPMTDQEAADALQLDRTTINARRSELIKQGHVKRYEEVRKNAKTHISNTTWGVV